MLFVKFWWVSWKKNHKTIAVKLKITTEQLKYYKKTSIKYSNIFIYEASKGHWISAGRTEKGTPPRQACPFSKTLLRSYQLNWPQTTEYPVSQPGNPRIFFCLAESHHLVGRFETTIFVICLNYSNYKF